MPFDEDLSAFFNVDEHGEEVAIGATAGIIAIFDDGYEEVSEVGGSNPELHVPTADIPAGTQDGTTVIARGKTWKVRGVPRPDISTNVTILDLEYQSG